MNRNGKLVKMFLDQRQREREAVAKREGKKVEDCQFTSYPADKRVRKSKSYQGGVGYVDGKPLGKIEKIEES